MALSYEFSIGSVRAKETSLFTKADVEHMLGLKTEKELVLFLNDKGYGEGDTIDEIAELNGTSVEQLLRLNPNLLPSDFVTGQVICLPTRRRDLPTEDEAQT